MYWFKVLFIMIVVKRLETVQNKTNLTDSESTTDVSTTIDVVKEISVMGCKNASNYVLSFSKNNLTNSRKWETSETNCCELSILNNTLIIDSHCLNPFCFPNVSVVEESNSYFLQGCDLNKIKHECPNQSVFNINQYSCHLKNFLVTPMKEKEKNYIYLNMTWNPIDEKKNVLITIEGSNESCQFFTLAMHDIQINQVNLPSPGKFPDKKIKPNCNLRINLNIRKCCFSYTVPECVENKCDCTTHQANASISKLEQISEEQFLIHWDPGTITPYNKHHYLNTVEFFYRFLKEPDYKEREVDLIGEPNFKENKAIVRMKLFQEENYVLHGYFKNNFHCSSDVFFDFKLPSRSEFFWLPYGVLAVVLIVAVFAHKYIIQFIKKTLRGIISGEHTQNLSEVENLQILQNYTSPVSNNSIQYTPVREYFDEYEFPRDKIFIKEVIGTGAFGRVYSAKAVGIGGIQGFQMVAVKSVGDKEHITKEAEDDFMAEIEIFKKIGKHPNTVTLLGCCTEKFPFMMIMELVPCGDLKKYLVELREQWVVEKNKTVFLFNETNFINEESIEPPSPTTPLSTATTTSTLPSSSICTLPDDLKTPLMAQFKQILEKVLDPKELQNFALQIAKGMAHLEKIPVTHRDLAARNILINQFKTLKISDFGMSRTGPYINQRTKKLPLRWMSIEAITEQKFDSKSDVWSFGVVLWEIGTLGAFPYEKVPDSYIQQFLRSERRLERPEICTDELYELMKQCWATDPDERPTFQELVDALDVKKKKVYVDFSEINPNYVFPPTDVNLGGVVPNQN